MGLIDPNIALPLLVAFTLAITVHEFAHAYIADQMGDPLPRQQGRVTLNPLAHMEFLGTLLIFLIGFGWGKPVMTRPKGRREMMWIALAGPVSNIILLVLFGLVVRFDLLRPFYGLGPEWFNVGTVLSAIININASLAVFNMIPLAPLDGSKVLVGILPDPYATQLMRYNAQFPMALFFFLLIDSFVLGRIFGVSILSMILGPIVGGLINLVVG